jgi:hypothetical protein
MDTDYTTISSALHEIELAIRLAKLNQKQSDKIILRIQHIYNQLLVTIKN